MAPVKSFHWRQVVSEVQVSLCVLVLKIAMISDDNFNDVQMIEVFISPSVSLKDPALGMTVNCLSMPGQGFGCASPQGAGSCAPQKCTVCRK